MDPQPTSTARRSIIGADPLDTLLGGGVFDGSTTMVVGISGAGKTVLAVQLLLEGAKKQGKRGLLVSLDEHPAQIVRNAETLGLEVILGAFLAGAVLTLVEEDVDWRASEEGAWKRAAEILRRVAPQPMNGSRRRAQTLRLAVAAMQRLGRIVRIAEGGSVVERAAM